MRGVSYVIWEGVGIGILLLIFYLVHPGGLRYSLWTRRFKKKRGE